MFGPDPPPASGRSLKRARSSLVWTLIVGLVLAALAKLGSIEAGWALNLFTVWIGGVLALGGMRALAEFARPEPSVLEAWMNRGPPAPMQPQRLTELQRLVDFSGLNAFDLNYRLRVVLRQIATQRLGRRGLTMDEDAARHALGDETWAFLAPPKGTPMITEGPGWKHQRIAQIVDAVERL